MLIDPDTFKNFNIRGVIQVGANTGQELSTFFDVFGAKKVIAFEPLVEILERIPSRPNLIKSSFAIGSCSGVFKLNVATNEGQSSSFLEPKTHLQEHSWVGFNSTRMVEMISLDEWFQKYSCHAEDYNFLSADVQGFELEVFKGATNVLKHIDYIMCEVNCKELYAGCPMVEDLDNYLKGFTRVKTQWFGNHGWGDALYVRSA